jgi:hypothetical protein
MIRTGSQEVPTATLALPQIQLARSFAVQGKAGTIALS